MTFFSLFQAQKIESKIFSNLFKTNSILYLRDVSDKLLSQIVICINFNCRFEECILYVTRTKMSFLSVFCIYFFLKIYMDL